MATPGSTIADRITDLIGSEYATVPSLSYIDLINAAFNEVADMLSISELMKYSNTPDGMNNDSGLSIEDKKVLKVTRVDANSYGIDRECMLLEQTKFNQASDSNSIYKATAFSPVYTVYSLNNASTLLIYPHCNDSGQIGRIWTFAYATNAVNLTAVTAATLNTSYYLPGNIIHAIVLKSCINILNTYLGEQIQEEEDIELMGMINTQLQTIERAFLQEMQRFTEKKIEVKGE